MINENVNGNMGKTALVTGGCGFVGRHITKRLLNDGYEVWIVDDLSTGQHPDSWISDGVGAIDPENFASRTHILIMDARRFFDETSTDERSEAVRGVPTKFDRVVHLAAVVGGRTKIEGDPLAVALDLAIDAEFFHWASKARPERTLYASSSAVYPTNLQSETHAIALEESSVSFVDERIGVPDMTYGWSKLTGEFLAHIAAKEYGLNVACVRPFSGYGEDQDFSYPIPAIARRAAQKEDPLIIWGSGNQGRDFVHIDDCMDAMMLALENISDGRAVNIGSGVLTTFREVARLFADLSGYNPEIVTQEDKPTGVHARYADPRISKELLGFEPKISLEEGFGRVLSAVKSLVAVSDY